MTAGWVAASTRGRALLARRVGADGARQIADCASWSEARSRLSTTMYGADLTRDASQLDARRSAATATSWQLRVLAGWCPPGATGIVRVFGAPFELANIVQHLARIEHRSPQRGDYTPLGSMAVAWPRVAATTTPEQVRNVLSHSPWGDPGGADAVTIACGLRVSWCRRLSRRVPESREWTQGALAVLIARERFSFGRNLADVTSRELDRSLGRRWRSARTIGELLDRLPASATWPFEEVVDPVDIWLAELALVRRASTDAERLTKRARADQAAVAAIMASLLVDLWHVSAAIAVAGRRPTPMEVFDGVA